MATTPNFEQIQSFNKVKKDLMRAAVDEFISELSEGITLEEVMAEATRIAQKYAMLGAELGAQWYDLCTELAGIKADAAEWDKTPDAVIEARAQSAMDRADTDNARDIFGNYLENIINDSVRRTGSANLWRDYERGLTPGKWARVPVGDTCAWCLMLASQGAWYVSEESALGKEAGHYHDDCDCVAVFHADPESIRGYSDRLFKYKEMYYDAENTLDSGDMPEELKKRIAVARAAHKAAYDAGETDKDWTRYNEDMIIMRYKYGLS